MSSSESDDWECPLCMEEMDIDDRGFFPCECGYQICGFCHNRISEDYGGRCPACRRLYSEQTPRWKPISPAQVAKIKNEKKAKEREKKEIESNSRRHLANVRVVQKNLVYVIGLPSSLSTEETLRSHDYFGQFGRINKIVINRRQNGSSAHHPTVGVYVTYAYKEDAAKAINAVDGSMLEGRVLRATFGTTKYCSYYLRSIPCQNPGCMYLHEPGEEADSFTKEDLAANRVGLRDRIDDDEDYGHDVEHRVSHRATSQSPSAHAAAGRGNVVSANSFPAFQNSGRSQTTAPPASAASASSHASAAAVSRIRKSSEINGPRPRSVEPHKAADSNDTSQSTGSALPATASWASRAMAKKPAVEPLDGRARKSESGGGTMTLRMIPASRGKAATFVAATKTTTPVSSSSAAAAAAASSSSTASGTLGGSSVSTSSAAASSTLTAAGGGAGRERLKANASTSDESTGAAASGTQATREKKQPNRLLVRIGQKAAADSIAETSAADEQRGESSKTNTSASGAATATNKKAAEKQRAATEAKAKGSADAGTSIPKQQETISSHLPASGAAVSKKSSQAQAPSTAAATESVAVAVAVAGGASAEAAAEPATTSGESAGAQDAAIPDQSETAANPGSSDALPHGGEPGSGAAKPSEGEANVSLSHTSSALSFQTITDSLFAQLNAKVSSPTNDIALPAFSGTAGANYDGLPGARAPAAGFPISSIDPLLFPPSIGADTSASTAAAAAMAGGFGLVGAAQRDTGLPFGSIFSNGQQQQASLSGASSQWSGGLGASGNLNAQSPLSALLTDPAALNGALGLSPGAPGVPREHPISTSAEAGGSSSRQRSRWDFVQADVASAQAELQLVLGRNGGAGSGLTGSLGGQHQQQQHQHGAAGAAAPAFASSRDLGMFSTPVYGNYAGNNPWSLGQQSDAGNTAPFPPPGFGSRKLTEGSLMQAESRSRSPMASGDTPVGGGLIGATSSGPNTLLSRLIGQSTAEMGSMFANAGNADTGNNTGYSAAQPFQDPAILSSYMAAAVAA
ncbi:transcriptional repressor general negative regulator of transcription subunit 4, partial [Coemansia sp. Benny D115]